MSVVVLINPISGGVGPSVVRTRLAVASQCADRDGRPIAVHVTERPGHARELAEAAVRAGARLVMAWGGDGTINEVASALAFTDAALGIVAGGSGNGLARQLGVDRRPERAIADAIAASPRRIDVGEIGSRLFVNLAGIGIDAEVASRFSDRGPGRRGFLSYLALGGRALATYVPAQYSIRTRGGVVGVRAVIVAIANSPEFGNGAQIAPGARLDDGLLDLVIVPEKSRLRTLCQVPRLFNGTVGRIAGCSIQRIEEATIECDQPMAFHVDGEPVRGGRSLTVRVHPGALRVCVRGG